MFEIYKIKRYSIILFFFFYLFVETVFNKNICGRFTVTPQKELNPQNHKKCVVLLMRN